LPVAALGIYAESTANIMDVHVQYTSFIYHQASEAHKDRFACFLHFGRCPLPLFP
jgi:hypothetical protein